MKKYYTRIENDVFDVASRLREIDDEYFVVYNNLMRRLEVHNSRQGFNTFCLVVPSNRLNAKTVELVRKTRSHNADKLAAEIDAHNEVLERSLSRARQEEAIVKANSRVHAVRDRSQ